MKRLKLGLSILFLGFFAVFVITCAGDKALNGIDVSPQNPSLPVGATVQFKATAEYNDQTTGDITTQATWSSSDTSVATINTSGLATAIAVGTTTITVTSNMANSFDNKSFTSVSTTLTVTSATLSSIAVTPSNPSIPVATTQQFTATATLSDGTTEDITTQATWSSSNTSVATINTSGLAAALATGTATITATSGTVSGSTTLTVP